MRKIHGTVDANASVRFGFTTSRNGQLVSLHFVGHATVAGASGKVYLLSQGKPTLEGSWKLNDPFARGRLIPGFNGSNPIGR